MDLSHKLRNLVSQSRRILLDPHYSLPIALLLLSVDAVLSSFILNRIPYTEIDWKAYMQQIAKYRAGERDYTKIYGDTGPLVYGAGHVYIYDLLYKFTDQGRDIFKGQCVYVGVYLLALGVVMAVYTKAKVCIAD